jgi:two-component system phosphate regulon response regulator PhoB
MVDESVLIVEDDADIRELLSYNLFREGFRATGVASGEAALEAIESHPPDLVVLDLMLPGVDGLSVCRKLKSDPRTASLPIVILSAKGEEDDVVAGLNLGADDYVPKPFSPKVLIARIQAVLRRHAATSGEEREETIREQIEIHDLRIHPGRHQVLLGGEPVPLTATEFRVLRLLASKPGWVFTRQQILDGVHGSNYAITDRAVDVQIVGLRKKLGTAGEYIETVRGVGYRLRE